MLLNFINKPYLIEIKKSGGHTDAQRREETGGGDSFLPVETKQVVARGWSHIKTEQGDDRGGR